MADERLDALAAAASDAAPDSPPTRYIPGGRRVNANRGVAWIREGWSYFRSQPALWALLALIYGALLIGLSYVPFVGAVATVLTTPIFAAGLILGCDAIERGAELELAHLFAGFRRNAAPLALVGVIGFVLTFVAFTPAVLLMGPTLFMSAMSGTVAAALGFTVLIGLLVTLAVFVPVNMALWFAPALVMLQGQASPHAVAESFRGCIKNIPAFLIYGLILLVLAVVATLPWRLGWLVLGPVVLGSVYASYRDIYAPRDHTGAM